MHRPHAFLVGALLAVAASACELTSDLGALKNGKCPPQTKACPDPNTDTQRCVSYLDPSTGCGDKDLAPVCAGCRTKIHHASTTCSETTFQCIVSTCDVGWFDCDPQGTDTDGCETNFESDVNHCNGCNTKCTLDSTMVHADPVCDHFSCSFKCKPGYVDCDQEPINGCECPPTSTCSSRKCVSANDGG